MRMIRESKHWTRTGYLCTLSQDSKTKLETKTGEESFLYFSNSKALFIYMWNDSYAVNLTQE